MQQEKTYVRYSESFKLEIIREIELGISAGT